MWNKISVYKCLKVSRYKPEEHPFRISALEICLGRVSDGGGVGEGGQGAAPM